MTSNSLQKIKKKELETLIQAVRIQCQDIGIEFDIEKFAMLVMKSGKRHLTDGMEVPNQDKIRKLITNETYKYLGVLEVLYGHMPYHNDTIIKTHAGRLL